jgi:hypothetical protein
VRLTNWQPRTNNETAPLGIQGAVTDKNEPILLAQTTVDLAEDLADAAAEQGEDTDDDDGDQHEDERILNQTLAFFPGEETANHCETSLEIGSN